MTIAESKNFGKNDTFKKYDNGKPPLAVLFDTAKSLEQVSRVIEFGAKKYGRKNWSLCEDKERYVSACLRHLTAYSQGERVDIESGLEHLAHATTNLLFLLEMEINNNDRA